MEEKKYQSPEVNVMELYSEGALCASNEYVDENEGEW